MSGRELDMIANIAQGFVVAYSHLADRTPSFVIDRPRVSGSASKIAPTFDPEILDPYLDAQRAVRHAYFRAAALGVPSVWPSTRDVDQTSPLDPTVLTVALNNMRRHLDQLDDNTLADLRAAERKLKPFWRKPPRPRVCDGCQADWAAHGRRQCWACVNDGRGTRRRRRSKYTPKKSAT